MPPYPKHFVITSILMTLCLCNIDKRCQYFKYLENQKNIVTQDINTYITCFINPKKDNFNKDNTNQNDCHEFNQKLMKDESNLESLNGELKMIQKAMDEYMNIFSNHVCNHHAKSISLHISKTNDIKYETIIDTILIVSGLILCGCMLFISKYLIRCCKYILTLFNQNNNNTYHTVCETDSCNDSDYDDNNV